MARGGEIELEWPDERRTYRLRIGELRVLQEKCHAGPMAIMRRLENGNWLVDDILEIIRLGAIGGGAKLEDAIRLKSLIELRPILEAVKPAQAILAAALVGVEDEPIGEAGGSEKGKAPAKTRATSGSSRTSTATAPSSAGRRSR